MTMIIDSDGSEYDWFLGYDPPPEKFQAQLEKSLRGEDTFKSISAAYAKDPKNIDTVFKLAKKYDDRLDQAKSAEKYKEVIALDPEGKAGTYTTEYQKITVPYTQYAEYAIATASLYDDKPDLGPAKAFIQKYPESKLVKVTYDQMARYYGYEASKEEAAKFFAEYTTKFPDDSRALDAWLSRIIRDKEPLDKGGELVSRLEELTRDHPIPDINANIAEFYVLKEDRAKADEVYGKAFMDDRVYIFAYDLVSYANFWLANNANQESAVAMAENALKLQPEHPYILQQVAGVYVKAGQDDKALAIFGPDYIKPKSGEANSLYGYARFWSAQGKNLDSALGAAQKAVDMRPDRFYFWSVLSDVQLKLKNYPEALKAAEKAYDLAEDYAKQGLKAKIDRIKKEQGEAKK